jgi:hypothetical protein
LIYIYIRVRRSKSPDNFFPTLNVAEQ